ncbi:MAG: helix-turn-helix domain-containing protein [Clostridiales bacterium]|nr:helix-turn-helix domain-containing protein [Clostridiales bacterium]
MDITNFGQTIAGYRKERAMTQEQLAQELGVTAQAVSKWENGQSYPDISLLAPMADIFEVSLDELFGREYHRPAAGDEGEPEVQVIYNELPWDDDPSTLHVVLFAGHRLVGNSIFQRHQKEKQKVEFCYEGPAINIHSAFSVICSENTVIQGSVNAGDSVTCGQVCGSVNAGDGVSCGEVYGDVRAGDGVNCHDVRGSVTAGDSVRCGNVGGNVRASDGVTCGDVKGDVRAGDSVRCTAVYGGASGADGVKIQN